MKNPLTMIASDGEIPVFGRAAPHPRSYGTFARVLGHYVRTKRILSLEEAVRKMSSMPAQRIGLTDRGLLRPGMKADLVLFDAEKVTDRATFENPHQRSIAMKNKPDGHSNSLQVGTLILGRTTRRGSSGA